KAHSGCRHLRVLRVSPSSSALKFFLRDAANRRLRKYGFGTGTVSLGANWTDQIRTPANDATQYSVSKERRRSRCIRDRLPDRLTEPDDRTGIAAPVSQIPGEAR